MMTNRARLFGFFSGILMALGAVLAFTLPAAARVGMKAPELTNEVWLNSEPQRLAELKGKVVLVEFWTFGCFNCRNIEPSVKEWHRQYADQGLVVIAVHAPEFNYERSLKRLQRYIRDHNIKYAVVVDNDFLTWKRYGNRYWPTLYLVDKEGIIRYMRIGEGGYARTESEIKRLLAED
ncbi:MAG: redoxin domain-containing protein [Candidatus Binatia bacterium]